MKGLYTVSDKEGCVTLSVYKPNENNSTPLLQTMVVELDDPKGFKGARIALNYLCEMLNNPELDARWHPEDEEVDEEEFGWVCERDLDTQD